MTRSEESRRKALVLGSLVPSSGEIAGIPVAAIIQSDASPGEVYPNSSNAVPNRSPSGAALSLMIS